MIRALRKMHCSARMIRRRHPLIYCKKLGSRVSETASRDGDPMVLTGVPFVEKAT